MFRLKLTYRYFRRYLSNSLISLFGMSLGLACFILVMLYVDYEQNFESFHDNSDRIYRIIEHRVEDGVSRDVVAVGPQVGIQSLQQFPEVENMTQLSHIGRFTLGNELGLRDYEEIYVADTSFFQLFSFPLLQGDPKSSVDNPHGILLSETLARKHFDGKLPPLGDSIWNNVYDAEISGVFKDFPEQSHLDIDMIMPLAVTLANFDAWENWMQTSWDDNSFNTYLEVRPGTDIRELENKLTGLVRENYPERLRESGFRLQAIRDIHFGDNDLEASLAARTGELFYVYFLAALGILVLVVATFNYANITTATALGRTREIGLRKTVGAGWREVISQFVFESLILVLISLLFGVFLCDLMLDPFNEMMGVSLSLRLTDPAILLVVLGTVLFVTITASAYPAWVIRRVRPAEAVKNRMPVLGSGKTCGKYSWQHNLQ